MSVKPIQHTHLSSLVYARLKEMIIAGDLKQGEKIQQERIAKLLGVSRMPLHVAFVKLEEEYLVESIPRRGIFVRKQNLNDIIEAFECRSALEGIAARRGAANFSKTDIIKLRALFEPFKDQDHIDRLSYQKADQDFHLTIIKESGNSLLQRLNNIGNLLIRTYPRGIILPIKDSLNDHFEIIAAFENRDPDKAELLTREHSLRAKKILEHELLNQKIQY